MELISATQDISVPQRCDECVKLIRKLRWVGLEDEAEQLQRALRRLPPEERGTVIGAPFSTD